MHFGVILCDQCHMSVSNSLQDFLFKGITNGFALTEPDVFIWLQIFGFGLNAPDVSVE